jgi:hypothetical protein
MIEVLLYDRSNQWIIQSLVIAIRCSKSNLLSPNDEKNTLIVEFRTGKAEVTCVWPASIDKVPALNSIGISITFNMEWYSKWAWMYNNSL